jgi:hypothetical protein
MRLVIAIPLGWAVSGIKDAAGITSTNTGAMIAFLVSMFSYDRIASILGGLANRALGVPAASQDETNDLVIRLPSVDQATSDKLAVEGITTIAQVASADPFRLSVRTGLPFDTVLNMIDAAILWAYVSTKLMILREFGCKGASNLLKFKDDASHTLDDRIKAYEQAKELRDQADAELTATTKGPQASNASAEADARKEHLQTEYDKADKVLSEARAALAGAGIVNNDFLTKMASQAKLEVVGLQNIIQQIARNSHAQFIAKVLTVKDPLST